MSKEDFLKMSTFEALKFAWKMYSMNRWNKETYIKALKYHSKQQVRSDLMKDIKEVFEIE